MRVGALLLAIVLAGCAADPDLADYNDILRQYGEPTVSRVEYDALMAAGRRAQARYQDSQFTEAGLETADTLAARGDQVRRAAFAAFIPGPIPVVELVRHADGEVLVRAKAHGGADLQAPATAQDWSEAVVNDAAAFAPPSPPKRRRRGEPLPPTPPVCHGSSAYLDAVDAGSHRRASASSGCGPDGGGRATMEAASALYATAARRLPECKAEAVGASNGFSAMLSCFGRLYWAGQSAKGDASR